MNYTAKDIEKAKELKVERFNWVVRNKNRSIQAFRQKPIKLAKEWVSSAHEDYDDWIDIDAIYFIPIKFENEEPASLDSIIASEKPKYERLTKRQGEYYLFDECVKCAYGRKNCDRWCDKTIGAYERLRELENKIESGELVFREVEE